MAVIVSIVICHSQYKFDYSSYKKKQIKYFLILLLSTSVIYISERKLTRVGE